METEKHVYGLCTCKNKLVLNSGLFVVSNITPQSMKKKDIGAVGRVQGGWIMTMIWPSVPVPYLEYSRIIIDVLFRSINHSHACMSQ
jgi:hypothetical protein